MVISSLRGLPIAMDLISVLILLGGLSKNGAGQVVEVQWRTDCGWEAVNWRWEVVNRRLKAVNRRWEVVIRRWEDVARGWKDVIRRWEAEQAVIEVGEGNAGFDVVYGSDCWFDLMLQAASRLEWSFRHNHAL